MNRYIQVTTDASIANACSNSLVFIEHINFVCYIYFSCRPSYVIVKFNACFVIPIYFLLLVVCYVLVIYLFIYSSVYIVFNIYLYLLVYSVPICILKFNAHGNNLIF